MNLMLQYVHRRECDQRGRGGLGLGLRGEGRGACDASQAAGSPHTHDSRASRSSPSYHWNVHALRERRHEVLECVVRVAFVEELQLRYSRHRATAA